jgi:molybdopterin synthase catalytic subunit
VDAVELSEFDAVELFDAKAAANSTAAVKKRPAIVTMVGIVRQWLGRQSIKVQEK